jgi:hypothetical protein
MIVGDFNVEGVAMFKSKTESVFLVYPDGVLSVAFFEQRVKSITGREFHFFECICLTEHEQFSSADSLEFFLVVSEGCETGVSRS